MSKFQKKPQPTPLQRNFKNIRNFSYAKGEVKLDFSLVIDDEKRLNDFVECLTSAIADIEIELKKLKAN